MCVCFAVFMFVLVPLLCYVFVCVVAVIAVSAVIAVNLTDLVETTVGG